MWFISGEWFELWSIGAFELWTSYKTSLKIKMKRQDKKTEGLNYKEPTSIIFNHKNLRNQRSILEH